jgi:hypothetical protein
LETIDERRDTEPRQPRQRSAVTNGRRLFVDGDGNSAWSRRYRDLVAGHVSDLGGDLLSEAQTSLIRRAAAIELELEKMEGRLSRGDASVDLDLFTRSAGHLRRIFETLGLQRRARDVTPPDPLVFAAQYGEAARR